MGRRFINILQETLLAETIIQDHMSLRFVEFFSAIIISIVNLSTSRTEVCELCALILSASAGWAKGILSQWVWKFQLLGVDAEIGVISGDGQNRVSQLCIFMCETLIYQALTRQRRSNIDQFCNKLLFYQAWRLENLGGMKQWTATILPKKQLASNTVLSQNR